jgi:hypothetical protein
MMDDEDLQLNTENDVNPEDYKQLALELGEMDSDSESESDSEDYDGDVQDIMLSDDIEEQEWDHSQLVEIEKYDSAERK